MLGFSVCSTPPPLGATGNQLDSRMTGCSWFQPGEDLSSCGIPYTLARLCFLCTFISSRPHLLVANDTLRPQAYMIESKKKYKGVIRERDEVLDRSSSLCGRDTSMLHLSAWSTVTHASVATIGAGDHHLDHPLIILNTQTMANSHHGMREHAIYQIHWCISAK